MRLFDSGSGPPIVVVPGIHGRWEWARPALGHLARQCRTISYSLCGDIGSDRPFDPALGFDNFVEQLDRVLDRAGVRHAAICGVSFGGYVALRYAARRPERVSALVWIASGVGGFEGPDDGIDWQAVERLWKEKRYDELVERETQIWVDGLGQPPAQAPRHVQRLVPGEAGAPSPVQRGEQEAPGPVHQAPVADAHDPLRLPLGHQHHVGGAHGPHPGVALELGPDAAPALAPEADGDGLGPVLSPVEVVGRRPGPAGERRVRSPVGPVAAVSPVGAVGPVTPPTVGSSSAHAASTNPLARTTASSLRSSAATLTSSLVCAPRTDPMASQYRRPEPIRATSEMESPKTQNACVRSAAPSVTDAIVLPAGAAEWSDRWRRAVLFHELIGFGPADARARASEGARRVMAAVRPPVRPGLAPHAPYSVSPDLFRAIAAEAAAAVGRAVEAVLAARHVAVRRRSSRCRT